MRQLFSRKLFCGVPLVLALLSVLVQATYTVDTYKNGCVWESNEFGTFCTTRDNMRPDSVGFSIDEKIRAKRERWIIFKHKDCDLQKYIFQELEKALKEDNQKYKGGQGTNVSQVIMEFEFKESKLAKAVSFDATKVAFEMLETGLDQVLGEFGILAPTFVHADQSVNNKGDVIVDARIHPKAHAGFPGNKIAYHTYVDPNHNGSLNSGKAKYKELEEDDWGVQSMINIEGKYVKRVPTVPLRRKFSTQVFVIGQGIDIFAKSDIELENLNILHGFHVLQNRKDNLKMSPKPIQRSSVGVSNLNTYQAQVIGSFCKHGDIIPVVIADAEKHPGDRELRAFEFIIESAKRTAKKRKNIRTWVTFSGKVVYGSKYDSYRFTEFIGKLLKDSGIFMTYGIDESKEIENLRTMTKFSSGEQDFKNFLHIGWFPNVLAVMTVKQDLNPSSEQRTIYQKFKDAKGFSVVYATGSNVYIPHISANRSPVYREKFSYSDNAIGAAKAAAVGMMLSSSEAFEFATDPFYLYRVAIQRSYNRVGGDQVLLSIPLDFCSIVEKYKLNAKTLEYGCVHRLEENFNKEVKMFYM